MAKNDPELIALRDQLAEAVAQIEALQAQAADATARAETYAQRASELEAALASTRDELAQARSTAEALQGDLHQARAEADSAHAEIQSLRAQLAEAGARLSEAALRYREARLAAAPHIPADLVSGRTIEEIDQQMEAAGRVVSQVRDRLQQEDRSARVPLGSPPRRPPDLSALSPHQKIKLGLEERSRRGGP